MQDISRDELTLLQTGCDKDSILTNNDSAFDRIKLGRTPEHETLPASIKLEDTADAFQWNTTSSSSSNIESNLLYVSADDGQSHSHITLIFSCFSLHTDDTQTTHLYRVH